MTTDLSQAIAFVTGLYQSVLNRSASVKEVLAWAAKLDAGELDASTLTGLFISSKEAQHDIIFAYQQAFGRAPTSNEIQTSLDGVASKTMATELGSIASNGALAVATDFVSVLYQQILNRTASAHEINEWAVRLAAGKTSQSALTLTFATCSESQNDLSAAYWQAFGRDPTPTELQSSIADLVAGSMMSSELELIPEEGTIGQLFQNLTGAAASSATLEGLARDVLSGETNSASISQTLLNGVASQIYVIDALGQVYGVAPSLAAIASAELLLQSSGSLNAEEANLGPSLSPQVLAVEDDTLQGTRSTSLAASGTAAPGSMVNLFVVQNGQANVELLGTTITSPEGTWAFAFPGSLGPGLYDLSAGSIDPSSLVPAPVGQPLACLITPIAAPALIVIDASNIDALSGTNIDATAAIQAYADEIPAAGGVLELPPGTYVIDQSIILKSGTTLVGNGTTLEKSSNWVWRPDNNSQPACYAMITNADFSTGVRADHDISIEGMNFNYNNFFNGGSHAIELNGVEGIHIEDCNFVDGNDGTALLDCDNSVVEGCTAIGTNNCAYDSWSGSSNAIVMNCSASIRSGYGILFDAVGTYGGSYNVSNVSAINNTVTQFAGATQSKLVGIMVRPLDSNSSIQGINISGNRFSDMGTGIAVIGNSSDTALTENSIASDSSGPAIFTTPDSSGQPTLGVIENNTLDNNYVSAGNVAEIQIGGDDYVVADNTSSSGSAPAFIWVHGVNDRVFDNQSVGSDGTQLLSNGSVSLTSLSTGVEDMSPLSLGTLAMGGAEFYDPQDAATQEPAMIATPGGSLAISETGSGTVISGSTTALQGLDLGDFLDTGALVIDDLVGALTHVDYRDLGYVGMLTVSDAQSAVSFDVGSGWSASDFGVTSNAENAAVITLVHS